MNAALAGKVAFVSGASSADAVRYAVTAPVHVAVNEILIRPTDQIRSA